MGRRPPRSRASKGEREEMHERKTEKQASGAIAGEADSQVAVGGLRVSGRLGGTTFLNGVAGQVVIKGQAWVGWEMRDPVLRCGPKVISRARQLELRRTLGRDEGVDMNIWRHGSAGVSSVGFPSNKTLGWRMVSRKWIGKWA